MTKGTKAHVYVYAHTQAERPVEEKEHKNISIGYFWAIEFQVMSAFFIFILPLEYLTIKI